MVYRLIKTRIQIFINSSGFLITEVTTHIIECLLTDYDFDNFG